MKNILFSFLMLFFLLGVIIYPVTPSSGLPGVAVSPDGKIVAVGGISRVIYIIDGVKMEVRERIWAGAQVLNLAFNKSGSTLVSENRDESLNFYDVKNFSLIRSFKNSTGLSVSRASDEVIAHSRRGSSYYINFHSMSDGSLLRTIPVERRIQLIGVDPGGKRLIILSKGKKNLEKIIPRNLVPKDLDGVEKQIFIQKNDGKVSVLLEYDPVSKKKISESHIFFTTSHYSKMAVTDSSVIIFTYGNLNAKISNDGKVTLFKPGKNYNYGIGISTDNKTIATGGLRRGMIYDVLSDRPVFFSIPGIQGWPEYFKGFAFSKDGKIFAGTSAFRLIKFNEKGKLLKAISVY